MIKFCFLTVSFLSQNVALIMIPMDESNPYLELSHSVGNQDREVNILFSQSRTTKTERRTIYFNFSDLRTTTKSSLSSYEI